MLYFLLSLNPAFWGNFYLLFFQLPSWIKTLEYFFSVVNLHLQILCLHLLINFPCSIPILFQEFSSDFFFFFLQYRLSICVLVWSLFRNVYISFHAFWLPGLCFVDLLFNQSCFLSFFLWMKYTVLRVSKFSLFCENFTFIDICCLGLQLWDCRLLTLSVVLNILK